MTTPVIYDCHMHTPLCKHARGEPEQYAAAAAERGLKGIIFTCHNPGPNGWSSDVRMEMAQFDEYVAMVDQARRTWQGRVDVQLGLESDYLPGMESWLQQLHAKADLNHVLGSVHPQLAYYKEKYYRNDILEFQRTYFNHLAMAAETGLFDTLSHPDLVKNVFPYQWNLDVLMDDIQHNLDRIAKTGVAMELNTSGLHKSVKEVNPNGRMLREIRERDIRVVLGSDAHVPQRVGADFGLALDMLEEAGFTHIHYYVARQPQAISLTVARESLDLKKKNE
jgi:histidinol-phosphatase (PHP family)